jgi:hypothetical protein
LVTGLNKFSTFFKDVRESFILIGGTACDLLLENEGLNSRATKDIDIVVIVESVNNEFSKVMWQFVIEGRYKSLEMSSGKRNRYRFYGPEEPDFPYMIELFSKSEHSNRIISSSRITQIPFEKASDLSAILLDEIYYELLLEGRQLLGDIYILRAEYLILFKMKAFLDLSGRKENGEVIDSRDIKKHKNDVFRLIQLINPETNLELPDDARSDVKNFINKVKSNPPDLKNLKIDLNLPVAIEIISKLFNLQNSSQSDSNP